MAMATAKLDQFNLVVSDMEAAVAFYRLLGLTIPDTLPEWQHHHRSVTTGEGLDFDLDSIDFAATWNRGWPRRAGGGMGVLGFRLPSRAAVDETVARVVAAGYRVQQKPYDAFWGARYSVVEDPDGNAVGLMSPVDPAMRTAPPTPPGAT
jgi:catechol 2,3-dioxygenase-like lactoylglutathione lyase family enzyme